MFFNTGLEYAATLEHLKFLEEKYDIVIEIVKPRRSIPESVREKGAPFWGKFQSEMIYRLQEHGFKWEDKPFEELQKEYPTCRAALKWWCNESQGNTTQYIIKRAPYLKEYMIQNPPQFKISSKCCDYAKKSVSKQYLKTNMCDLVCLGIRKSEGGIRSSVLSNCFSEGNGLDTFRPIFWFRDIDKDEYCKHYNVTHSRCYTEYGLIRTGCFGCPFGKRFESELSAIEKFEPRLLNAANNIFGESYEYTRGYLKFREMMKNSPQQEDKTRILF